MNMNQIVYGQWTFTDTQIHSASVYLSTSLMSDSLEANTFTADVECTDRSIIDFERNAPLVYSHKGMRVGIFYVQDIVRIGPTTYTISATSAIGMLIEGLHYGGIYNGETVAEILPSICGSVPYEVKSSLQNIALYGWLPVASPRDNLSQVLFAVGATVKTDLNGILRIEGLWNGLSGSIGGDKLYRGQSVEYEAKVTRVVVTEHQYTEGSEETELFAGTTQQGDIITFDEPMHNLVASGFSVTESGANYAVVTAGTGTLTGKKYIHNTRQVSRDVTQANSENVVSVEDATLVSLVNSVAVAERLANYYQCRETITGDVVLEQQATGDVVTAYHPYDLETVQSCIKSLEINVSNTLRAAAVQLVGFEPIQISEAEYYDYREVITQDGPWIVPQNVTSLVVVCIGSGWGGYSGQRGGDTEEVSTINYTEGSYGRYNYRGYFASVGGSGGPGGNGGSGGRIFQQNLDVSPGDTFQVTIGKGGAGGVYSSSGSMVGSEGTATTFGSVSSASGSPSSDGYTDPVTGEKYATPGPAGIAGGSGSGGPTSPPARYDTAFVNGSTVTDRDGNRWTVGRLPVDYSDDWRGNTASYKPDGATGPTTITGEACFGLSGGAAVGANGTIGGYGNGTAGVSSNGTLSATATAGVGGRGANASAPGKIPGNIGQGGYGGNGGGGAGGSGHVVTILSTPSSGITANVGTRRESGQLQSYGPGNGSNGGVGGDGCVILYYRLPKESKSGAIMGSENRIRLDKYGRLMVG